MKNIAKKIEKLEKFIVKALTKAIEAGNKIISLYVQMDEKITKLKEIISKLEEILAKMNEEKDVSND